MRKKIILAVIIMMIVSSFVNVFSNTSVALKPEYSEATPADNAVNIDINTPLVSVLIRAPDDQINWTIEGQYIINAGVSYTGDGTKTANLTTPLPYNTNIIWYVNATDGIESTQAEYNFYTRAKYTPNPPSGFAATVYSESRINLTWTKGDKADRTYIERSDTPSWDRGDGTFVYNNTGTYYLHSGLTEGEHYYYQAWSWNETDHVFSDTNVSTDAIPANQRPVFSVVTPANDTTNVDIHTSEVSVLIQDPDGDMFNWTIQGQYIINEGINGSSNGTKDAALLTPLPETTDIIWYVNATDGNGWTNASYSFMTRNFYLPSIPSGFTATVYSKSRINLTWTKGDKADWTIIERNTSSSWSRGQGIEVYNDSGSSYQDSGLTENVTYYYQAWSWNETDHIYSTSFASDNEMTANQRPLFSAVTPADNTGNIDIYIDGVSVYIQDPDADLFDWTIEGAYLTPAGTNNASNGTKSASFYTTLPYTTNIKWYVNATDGYGTKTIQYNFTTRPNLPPVFSSITPANNSTNININTPSASVYIRDPDGERFDWTIEGKYVINTGAINVSQGTKSASLLTPLPKDTTITWYVNATDPDGSDTWTSMTYHFSTTTTPLPTRKYSTNPGIGLSAVGPIVADVNNDGKMEILRSGPDGVVCLDGATYATIWRNDSQMWNDHCPMEAIDLNKDGILEVITSYGTGTRALHGNNGSLYWYNPDAPLQNKYCVAGDIDGDGYPEVFVCAIGSVTALTHDGHIFAHTWTYYPCFGGLTLGDTDYDGVFELYQGDRSIYYHEYPSGGRGCISYWASNLTVRWYDEEVLCSSQCPTLIDVDKDGKLDVVICSQSGGGFCVYNSSNGEIIHQTLNIPWVKTHSQASIYDIDGDGNLEIIACRDWSLPVVWDLYDWKVDAWLPYPCYEPPAIADINGDGFVEIICCTRNNISIFNHDYQFMGNITPALSNPSNYGMSMIVAQDIDADGLLELIFNRVETLYVYDTVGPAPTPKALSQFNFYSQHRGRAPYYVEYEPAAPIVKNENPANGSINIGYNPQLSVHVFDYQNNSMTITFRTNASGSWSTIRTYTNAYEGTYTASTTGMNQPSKYYWWRVIASDSTGNTTTETYNFRTIDTMILSSISPADLATNVALNPQISVNVEQRAGRNMTIHFRTNASGSWVTMGSHFNATNGTYSQSTTFSLYNKKYYWSVNCSDGQYWVNETFSFTTRSLGGGSGGGVIPDESENDKPIADASQGEPYHGFVNDVVLFDGSKSYDPDGNVTNWFWNFGDNTSGNGKTVTHTYSEAGTYTVTLTVTDNEGATDTDTTTCVIQQQNRPPSQPTITGPIKGTKNTLYLYTAVSTDADNDMLKYTFAWSGSESQSSKFISNNTSYTVSHSWATAGRYNVTVIVTDNQTKNFSKITVYIDALQIGDIGYLLDNDGDGIYDAFYSEETKQTTTIQKKDSSYLIDSNGDGKWDYTYNITSGQTSSYEPPKTPGFELVFVLSAIAVAIFLWRKKKII